MLDESRPAHVTEPLVDMEHRGVLGVVVRADHRHAELRGLGEGLQLYRPRNAAAAEVGVGGGVSGPHGPMDRWEPEVRHPDCVVAVEGDPEPVMRPVRRIEPILEVRVRLGNYRHRMRHVLNGDLVQLMQLAPLVRVVP